MNKLSGVLMGCRYSGEKSECYLDGGALAASNSKPRYCNCIGKEESCSLRKQADSEIRVAERMGAMQAQTGLVAVI